MKFSFRKTVLWILAAVVIITIFVQPTFYSGKYNVQVETISNKCSFDENPEQEIRTTGSSIVIIMPIQTATPCYEVEGTMSSYRNDLTVDLKTVRKGEICVECLGTVVARVTISNLNSGEYSLHVNAPDKSITQTVNVK